MKLWLHLNNTDTSSSRILSVIDPPLFPHKHRVYPEKPDATLPTYITERNTKWQGSRTQVSTNTSNSTENKIQSTKTTSAKVNVTMKPAGRKPKELKQPRTQKSFYIEQFKKNAVVAMLRFYGPIELVYTRPNELFIEAIGHLYYVMYPSPS